MKIAPGKVIAAAVIALVAIICFVKMAHVNDVQNLQVIQSVTGEVSVRKQAGWYFMMCPRIWKYSKAGVYQLNAEDKDLLDIQFKNKFKTDIVNVPGPTFTYPNFIRNMA